MYKLITVTTDFGDQFAAAQLKAIIAVLGFDGEIIENHSVSSFSIAEGAFQINLISKFSPSGTVHLGVIDPGVGSNRRGIIVKTKNFWFVGPDNGLLYPAIENDGIENSWVLSENKISQKVSSTFHGRDVFIKAAVYAAQGKRPENFGCCPVSNNSLKKINFRTGQVLHIDSFGNIKIYWPNEITVGRKLLIKNKKIRLELPIVKTFSDVPQNSPLAIIGSSYTLELAVNLGNAAAFLGINNTDILDIAYKP
ncbi:SAM-dependent chlorinase/fluorinase [Patescibacteria group bacterium]|nr:SAM-dependent chlorinase/fluorinase [Patescibacteria group bacterium]MCL5797957.1 SAM-dependent chlorinase/fluorinase [Patescibacteria group bacterium]